MSREEGTEGSPDEEHLRFAAIASWVLVTRNEVDFLRLHASWISQSVRHSGIVIIHQWRRQSIGQQINALHRLASEVIPGRTINVVEYLTKWVGLEDP